jgi:hypothetical protein
MLNVVFLSVVMVSALVQFLYYFFLILLLPSKFKLCLQVLSRLNSNLRSYQNANSCILCRACKRTLTCCFSGQAVIEQDRFSLGLPIQLLIYLVALA